MSLYLQMRMCSPLRTSYGKALDRYNFMGPFTFYCRLVYCMNALYRTMHLFRQSNKTNFYADPDVKCFLNFVSPPQSFEARLHQCLFCERYAHWNCSKIHGIHAFPNCSILQLQNSRKKKKKSYLTQNCSVGSDRTKHNIWLQKIISHSDVWF